VSKRRRDLSRVSDLEFARALSFGCAYCGRSKDDAPPLWCVRSHEGWEAAQSQVEQKEADVRRCEGCEGSGFVDRCYCQTATQHMDACEGRRCLVCQGSGQVTDRIPVADALADAETLRRISDGLPLRCTYTASLWARGHFYETEDALVWDGIFAAHEAFRAVPGLRGEQ